MSSKNFMSYEDATTVLGAYAEAIKNKQDALTAGDYINLNNGNISVNRNLVVDNYLYTIGTNDAYYITVTKSQGGEIISTNTYSYSRGTVTNVDGNFTITHDYDNRLGYVWVYTSLKDSAEHTVGYTWTKAVTDTPFSVDEAFPSEDVSGYKLVIKSEMDTALAGKQNTLTFDDTPTDNSNNPVKSNGIYDALALKQDATDNSLDTEAKTIVGAINEHEGDIGSLKSGLTNLDDEVNGDATTYDYADVITIEDAVPSNLAECNVKIEPVQDLHGYSQPWVGGAGKNEIQMTLDNLKTWNTLGTWNDNVYSYNNVTVTVNTDDGGNVTEIIVNTPQASAQTTFKVGTVNNIGQYWLTGCPEGGSQDTYALFINNLWVFDYGPGANANISATGDNVSILVANGAIVSNKTFNPMLCLSSNPDPKVFAPYTNICPISGHTEASVQRDGRNLFPSNNAFVVSNDGDMVEFATKGNTTYIISMLLSRKSGVTITNDSVNVFMVQEYDANNAMIKQWGSGAKYLPSGSTDVSWNKSFTTDSRTVNIKLYLGNNNGDFNVNTVKSNIQLELGSSATDYEPYQGKTYTIALGDTIYGGTVDFDSGVMTVDRAGVDMGTLTWTYHAVSELFTEFFDTNLPNDSIIGNSEIAANIISPLYKTIPSSNIAKDGYDNGVQALARESRRFITCDKRYSNAADYTNAVDGNILVYELATPTTIQLTPQQIQLLQGQNTLTASTGQISVTVNGVSGSIGAVQEQVNELSANVGGAKLKTLKYTGTGTTSYTLDFGDDTPATIMQIIPEPGETVITNNYEYLSGFAWGVPFTYGAWANKSNNLPSSHGGFNISQITYSDNTCTIIGPSASAAANYEGQKYAVYYLA